MGCRRLPGRQMEGPELNENQEHRQRRDECHHGKGYERSECEHPANLPSRGVSARFNRLTRGAATRNKCSTTPRPTETGAHRPLPDRSALFQRLTNRTINSSTHAPMKALIA